jgi:hypothetical protein
MVRLKGANAQKWCFAKGLGKKGHSYQLVVVAYRWHGFCSSTLKCFGGPRQKAEALANE